MKHRPRELEQDDLLRPRLVDMIDLRHELVKLAGLIDWDVFEREWAGFFPSTTGRPASPPRLVAGPLYLQHAFRLSDEAVVARWVENPYFQHFIGHMKSDGRLARCPLRGTLGDALFAVLCGCGHNIRKLLAWLRAFLAFVLAALFDENPARPSFVAA